MNTELLPFGIGRYSLPLVLLLVVLCTSTVGAQVPSPMFAPGSAGYRYRLAFPDTVTNTLDARFPNNRVRTEATIWMFSAVKNTVRITDYTGTSRVLNLEGGTFKAYTLQAAAVVDVVNTISRKTFLVEADQQIILYCYFASTQGTETWAPIPAERWGLNHQVACVPGDIVYDIGAAGADDVATVAKPAPATILVIADRDSTVVSLELPPDVKLLGNPPATVVLNAGESFQFVSIVDTTRKPAEQQEIGGTLVRSNKPIGVITGNPRAQIVYDVPGIKNNAYKGMMFEWVPPTNLLGREFVFLPTWDNHRPGIGSNAERLREFARVYNAGGARITGSTLTAGNVAPLSFDVQPRSFREFSFSAPVATHFRTNSPAMAIMHSSAIVKYNGSTPCSRGIPCRSFSAWVPYMSEMVPREQWVRFAPYYAPTNPGSMLHFVSVVTDTISMRNIIMQDGSPFPFTRRIPGTDLIWGSRSVTAGNNNWIMSKDTGTFTGVAFGLQEGGEEYRPGATRKKDGSRGVIAGGGNDVPDAERGCEFEEYNAVSYGYPLAPARRVYDRTDTIRIDTSSDGCGAFTIAITFLDQDPSGFTVVRLNPAQSVNARLVYPGHLQQQDIAGLLSATVTVAPIDGVKEMLATVAIESMTGQSWNVVIAYTADPLNLVVPQAINFGALPADSSVTREMVIRNSADHPIVIAGLAIPAGHIAFTIDSIPGTLPLTVPAGDSLTVRLRYTARAAAESDTSRLHVILRCGERLIGLMGRSLPPTTGVDEVAAGRFGLDAALRGQRLVVQASAPEGSRVGITVFDALGTVVATVHEGYLSGAIQTFEVDASALPSGVYYCRMRDGQRERIQSIVVVH